MPPTDDIPADSAERITTRSAPAIACPQCDLLQREITPCPGGAVRCRRCGALLYRNIRHGLDNTVAFLLAAAVLYVIANVYPIVAIEAQGISNSTTLFGAVGDLLNEDLPAVALLVFATTILAPAIEIAAMLYLLLPLRIGHVPPAFRVIMRVVHVAKRWNMVEVFMLGVLVSLVRLSRFANVIPDIALWSFAGVTLLMTAAAASFDPHDIWKRADRARSEGIST